MTGIEPGLQMWLVLGVVLAAIIAFVSERLSIELISLMIVASLTAIFHFWPMPVLQGLPEITTKSLIAGLADPALITVLALMVVGQGMIRTGALEAPIRFMAALRRYRRYLAVFAALTAVCFISSIMNNTPVVVIFIPIMLALAQRLQRSPSSLMIPLSYAAMLGGMTTLIGSSTNLLVSAAAVNAGEPPIGFFDFTITGLILAGVGLIYAIFVAPRLLPDRASYAQDLTTDAQGKQFIAQIDIRADSPLIGQTARLGQFPDLPDITIRLIQRGEHSFLPPFDDMALRQGDELVIAATRDAITGAISRTPALLQALHGDAEFQLHAKARAKAKTGAKANTKAAPGRKFIIIEAMVAPASRILGQTLAQSGFHARTGCTAIGVQRRNRMIRQGPQEIPLESGDILLLLGPRPELLRLRGESDITLLEWSAHDLPALRLAWPARAIFLATVILIASGVLPMVVAALLGATAMLASGCLSVREAVNALDRRVVMLIWSALAMGAALYGTGGADWLAGLILGLVQDAPPIMILSVFFLMVAVFTNILSNNATAVLFTPIGVGLARSLDLPPDIFVFAALFGANCSFATPMGYQTNLLVMGPGHYRFADYFRAGAPLVIIIWLAYTAIAAVRHDLI